MSADIVVLGAGVIGTSIAYHLARRGARVHLVDQGRPAGAPSASWASAGGLRSQGRSAPERPVSLRAAARWRTLAEELDADLEVRFDGHLHLAEREEEVTTVATRIAEDRSAGITIESVGADDLTRLVPTLARGALLGAFTPGDGQAHPGRTARAFAAGAQRAGATATFAQPVELHHDPTGGLSLRVGGEPVAAGHVVLAAGAWSVAILDRLGLVLPLRWRGLQMLLSEIAPPLLQPTVTAVGRNLSLKQSPTGQMMVGGRWLASPVADAIDARPVEAHVAPQWAGATALMPALAPLALAQTWAGVEAQSIDGMPFVGPSPMPGLYVATGFSNHGFQIAPAIGELVAEDLLSGAQPLLAPFRLERASAVAHDWVALFRAEPLPS